MSIQPKASLLGSDLVRPDWQSATPRRDDLVWLDKNENLDPTLLTLTQQILGEVGPRSLAIYPDLGELYRKLAQWVGISPESLILTAGSDGAIRTTFQVFVNEGDKVVHTSPTFAMYSVYCQMFGAHACAISYERGKTGPVLTTETILACLSRESPKLFCLPNPDSPTGTVIPPEELRAIVELCGKLGCVALIDEAYHPFYQDSCVSWTQKYEHLIVVRTFAKAWGLAGLRIGYAVGNPATMRYFHKQRPMYEVSTVAAAMIERMLDFPDQMRASVHRLNEGKRYFLQKMECLGFDVLHGEGNFLHVAFGPRAMKIHRALQDRVLYRPDFNEPCLKGYSRFSSTTVKQFEPIVDLIASASED